VKKLNSFLTDDEVMVDGKKSSSRQRSWANWASGIGPWISLECAGLSAPYIAGQAAPKAVTRHRTPNLFFSGARL